MKITKQRLKQIIREELQAEAKEDAMRNSIRKGRYIDDIPDREDEETVDRAFDSPEGRLITHIEARKVLDNMTIEELEDFAMSLDASMAATLRHILSNRMYDPMEEGLFSQSMAVQGEIDKHVLNLFRVLEALRPVDRKEIIDDIINELQAIANEDSLPQIGDDPRDQSPL